MLSGYVLTDIQTARTLMDALAYGDAPGFRYVGTTEDGGFAAFDAETQGDVTILRQFGKLYMLQPNPDDPDSWPDWARGPRPSVPKRGIAQGDERFILLRSFGILSVPLDAVAPQARAAAIVHSGGEEFVLVELGASDPFVTVDNVVWDRVITEFADARLVMA